MNSTATKSQAKAALLLSTEVTDSEVTATFRSESDPSRKHETVLNRFTGKARCSCRGYAGHGHCWHQEALTEQCLRGNLIKSVRTGAHRREARAVIDDYDHFADLRNTSDVIHALKVKAMHLDRRDVEDMSLNAEDDREYRLWLWKRTEFQNGGGNDPDSFFMTNQAILDDQLDAEMSEMEVCA